MNKSDFDSPIWELVRAWGMVKTRPSLTMAELYRRIADMEPPLSKVSTADELLLWQAGIVWEQGGQKDVIVRKGDPEFFGKERT